jgi:epoxyqueuosine reductase
MGLRQNLKRKVMVKLGKPKYIRIIEKEESILQKYECIESIQESPIRFEIPLEAINLIEKDPTVKFFSFKALPTMGGSMIGISKGFKQISNNPKKARTEIEDNELEELKEFVYEQDVGMIGFCKLPPQYIFKNKGILYENGIVLIMEMKKEKINSAPSYDAFHEVHRTYRDLGFAANNVATWLRERKFGAHPIHPLGGAVLTPPLAKLAGLGWEGRHGMIITPKYGPRMRIAVVFTSIKNLPMIKNSEENEHAWISDWCKKCGVCIRTCPSKAILTIPKKKNNSILTHIVCDKCFPFFLQNHGCSICIKECMFNTLGYDRLKTKNEKIV